MSTVKGPLVNKVKIQYMGVSQKIRGTFLGVPIRRITVFRGPYWGPLFWKTTI